MMKYQWLPSATVNTRAMVKPMRTSASARVLGAPSEEHIFI